MASAGKGKGWVKTVEWWDHLRWKKRLQNKLVRVDGKKVVRDATMMVKTSDMDV